MRPIVAFWKSRWSRWIVVAAAAVGVAAFAVSASFAQSAPNSRPTTAPGTGSSVSAGGPDAESGDADAAAYVASFTALQRPATSQDDLPSDPGNGTITTARRFADAPYGAWIALEGDSQICVIVALAGTLPSACDSPASLAQSNQLLITSAGAGYDPPSAGNTGARPPDQVLAGIAPDGVAAVTIEFSDGSSRTVAVHDNGFETALGSPNPVGFRWSTHGVEYTQGEAS